MMARETTFKARPDVKKFIFNWTNWLDGATIASSSFAIEGRDDSLTFDTDGIEAGAMGTSVIVRGGNPGKKYKLSNQIVTAGSPSERETQYVYIKIAHE